MDVHFRTENGLGSSPTKEQDGQTPVRNEGGKGDLGFGQQRFPPEILSMPRVVWI